MFTPRMRHGLGVVALAVGALVVSGPAASAVERYDPYESGDLKTAATVGLLSSGTGLVSNLGSFSDAVTAPRQMLTEVMPFGILGD
jgi:hypothetical protein